VANAMARTPLAHKRCRRGRLQRRFQSPQLIALIDQGEKNDVKIKWLVNSLRPWPQWGSRGAISSLAAGSSTNSRARCSHVGVVEASPLVSSIKFPDGRMVLLTVLEDDQAATVLQLPAQAVTTVESNAILRHVQS
jgi:hypothetical protein